MDYRGFYPSSFKSPTRNNIDSNNQQRVYSPRAGYIRDRVSDRVNDLKDLLAEHQQNTATKLVRAHADMEHLSHEKDRARRQQQRNLESLEQLSEEVRHLSEKLRLSEERCDNYKAGMRRMKVDMERIMDVNASLETRLATLHDRLLKIMAQFRRQHHMPVDVEEVAAIEHYIRYLEQLLEESARKLEAEAGRSARVSKQLDNLISKYKILEAESAELTQQLDLQTKQRQIEQVDVNRLQQQFAANLNHDQLRLKKIYEAELSKTKEKAEKRKQKNCQLKTELSEVQKTLHKANSNANDLMEQLEDANTHNHLMGAQLEELKSMLSQASRQMGLLEDQYGQLKGQLIEVEKQLVRRSAETEEYRQSLKTTTFELQNGEHERRLLRQKLLDYERKANSLDEETTKSHKQLARADDECQQLRRENKQLKESVQDLRRIITRQEQALLRQKKEKEQLELTILHPDPEKDKLRRRDFLERIAQLERIRDSPKKHEQKSHKLKVIGELQSMVKTHKQIYQAEPENG